jgi:hypothetical protein
LCYLQRDREEFGVSAAINRKNRVQQCATMTGARKYTLCERGGLSVF